MKYNFYVTAYKSGGKGQGNTQTDTGTEIQKDLIGKTDRYKIIETTRPIGLVFSWRGIQLEYLWEK